ncbi:hypothetical protein [Chitinophaga sancti]|uniref:Uncharacterized protein n=1 Tax=Chitinophaga sancti TaxID=1004 RepID=A0ABZ0XIJ8_9BACT|nr:hypothetical protein [Chitinophaga sancti]WQD63890.1 hypothetical protein U0033_05740 [Chitinophaga sancti]WQG90485.1 hypothetical protein SR876_03180 [Chitinophaga sancti]
MWKQFLILLGIILAGTNGYAQQHLEEYYDSWDHCRKCHLHSEPV